MSERDDSFCGTMRRFISDEKEMDYFNRYMGDFCNRTDSELLADIRSECHRVSQEERHECLREIAELRGNREFDNHEMRRRTREVTNTLNVSDPPPTQRRRRSRLLRPLILLFLLRGIRRRR